MNRTPALHPLAARRHPVRFGRSAVAAATCLFAVFIAGCDSGGDSSSGDTGSRSPDETTAAVTADATGSGTGGDVPVAQGGALSGTWDRCTGRQLRSTYVFSGNRFDYYLAYFQASDCSGEPIREEGLQSPDRAYVSGSYEIRDTTTSEEGLTARKIDIVTESFQGSALPASVYKTQYDIVFSGTADELAFGVLSGSTEDKRPTALDLEKPYRRR